MSATRPTHPVGAWSRTVPLVLLLHAWQWSPATTYQLGEQPKHSAADVGFTQGWGELTEDERLEKRKEAGWKWRFPHESPTYREWQDQRREEILDLFHYQERLDNWVQYVQIRSVTNFTRLGFDVVDAPEFIFRRLRDRLKAGLDSARPEMGQDKRPQGIYGDIAPDFVPHNTYNLLGDLQHAHEQWAPAAGPLIPSASYGMRVYRRGSTLAWHADRVDTHVISSILHVGHHYDNEDEPWPIEIEGHDGVRHEVALRPGQMLMYESAKCPHGRSTPLKGDWYASVFSHYRPQPEVWSYTQHDVWLALPPQWDARPLSKSGAGRWAGAFLTHDSMEVAGMPPRDGSQFPRERRPVKRKFYQFKPAGPATAKTHEHREAELKRWQERQMQADQEEDGGRSGWLTVVLGSMLVLGALGAVVFLLGGGTMVGLQRLVTTRGRSIVRHGKLKDEDHMLPGGV